MYYVQYFGNSTRFLIYRPIIKNHETIACVIYAASASYRKLLELDISDVTLYCCVYM